MTIIHLPITFGAVRKCGATKMTPNELKQTRHVLGLIYERKDASTRTVHTLVQGKHLKDIMVQKTCKNGEKPVFPF